VYVGVVGGDYLKKQPQTSLQQGCHWEREWVREGAVSSGTRGWSTHMGGVVG